MYVPPIRAWAKGGSDSYDDQGAKFDSTTFSNSYNTRSIGWSQDGGVELTTILVGVEEVINVEAIEKVSVDQGFEV